MEFIKWENWITILNKQKELDEKINETKGFVNHKIVKKNHNAKKKIALLVEVGEFLNEVPRVFKFWSEKENDLQKATVELVDCIHFASSLLLDECEGRVDLAFAELQKSWIYDFEKNTSVEKLIWHIVDETRDNNYNEVIKLLLLIGSKIGISQKEIEYVYFKKNEINVNRQNTGY